MGSREKPACMEFVFVREDSESRQEKVKAFWKFLDSQNCLQPHKGTLGEVHESSEAESAASSLEEAIKEKDIWRKGLKVFQQLGLDKAAFAADKKCRPCHMQKTIRIFATVTPFHATLMSDTSHERVVLVFIPLPR
ncbi:uncharacterized protein LOC114938416 isoform X2 [Nylanderia fulva]|uniref:uncharacterized protein LOC114938416 isoform X2 n=1 Tax=Nylanderia fulva TaxID=613905 RepID=UPI0010FB3C72|nr:uncharacterized protein LOC114938416 isoform X2 [Nylanderia fulva]